MCLICKNQIKQFCGRLLNYKEIFKINYVCLLPKTMTDIQRKAMAQSETMSIYFDITHTIGLFKRREEKVSRMTSCRVNADDKSNNHLVVVYHKWAYIYVNTHAYILKILSSLLSRLKFPK